MQRTRTQMNGQLQAAQSLPILNGENSQDIIQHSTMLLCGQMETGKPSPAMNIPTLFANSSVARLVTNR